MIENGNMADVVGTGPSALELSALLEKQNKVLSALVGELETCKSEMLILRNRSPQEISKSNMLDKKQEYAENTWKEISGIDEIVFDGSKKFSILKNYLEEIRKANHRAENLSQELEVTKAELSRAVEMDASKQIHIDFLNELLEKERKTRSDEFLKLNDRLVDKTREFDDLCAENRALKAQLTILEDSVTAKEKLVNDLTRATAKELEKRDEADKVLAARLSVLTDENATLRTSLLTLGANELSPQSKKLLAQQQGFIVTLKSECEILMNRLMKERNEHRKERKQLRRQIRALNTRLDCLISGKQEITDA